MKLHTVFISYKRLHLTKIAISSYMETVSVPYSVCVVDNGSDEETIEWLLHNEHDFELVLLWENKYPGYACNRGFLRAPSDATHLHRADNDFRFLPEWCREVKRRFSDASLGQLGLRTGKEENFAAWNVGGNAIFRRELWDKGLRYEEKPWTEYPPGWSEDSLISPRVNEMGYRWDRVKRPCIESLASGDWSDPYYQESYGARRIQPNPKDPTLPGTT